MKKITLLLSALFLAVTSYSQVLISWDVSGVDLDTIYASSPHTFNGTLGTNIGGGALTLSTTILHSTGSNEYGYKVSSDSAHVLAGTDKQTTLAGAITADHYIQFTLEAADGYTFSISSIDLRLTSTGSASDSIALMTDVDNFVDGNEINADDPDFTDATGLDVDKNISISGSQYEGLSSLTFRIYGWGETGSGTTRIANDNGNDLVINGTTALAAVPESSTYALIFGAATLGFVMYRRRS